MTLKLSRNTLKAMGDDPLAELRSGLTIGKIRIVFVEATLEWVRLTVDYGTAFRRLSVFKMYRNSSVILEMNNGKQVELGIDKTYPNSVKVFVEAPKSVKVRRLDYAG